MDSKTLARSLIYVVMEAFVRSVTAFQDECLSSFPLPSPACSSCEFALLILQLMTLFVIP